MATSGGKNRRSAAARVVLQPWQAVADETLCPFPDVPSPWHELAGYGRETLPVGDLQDHLGTDYAPMGSHERPGSALELGTLLNGEHDA
jgi:hypothetical protein